MAHEARDYDSMPNFTREASRTRLSERSNALQLSADLAGLDLENRNVAA